MDQDIMDIIDLTKLVMSLDIPEEQKQAIVDKHMQIIVEHETMAKRAQEEQRKRFFENNRGCVEMCRGALAAVSAMLEGMSGTHRMKHFQAMATAQWIRAIREKIKFYQQDPTELPF